MWEAGWAGDIAWFQFGKKVMRPDRHGRTRQVGEYALHISSSWTWRSDSGFVRADEDATDLSALGLLSAHVQRSDADQAGHLVLRMDNGDALEVLPDAAVTDPKEEIEYWRVFQPGLERPHVVASNTGIEWHEA